MAAPAQNFAGYGVRCLILIALFVTCATAQQAPFLKIDLPNSIGGAAELFQDSRGGLWLGGFDGTGGLRYFDGRQFVTSVDGLLTGRVSGISEDSEGGIWVAFESAGLVRLFHGQIQKMLEGPIEQIVSAAPNVFLVATHRRLGQQRDLIRFARDGGIWKGSAIAKISDVQMDMDAAGSILYPCAGGFCEVKGNDVKLWQPGLQLRVTKHPAVFGSQILRIHRDSLSCLWITGVVEVAYQCPADPEPQVLPVSVAGSGSLVTQEMSDSSIVIASFNRLAIGRPGKFRVLTVENGYPSVATFLVTRDDSVWISNTNGLFVLPPHLAVEFWTERDGLDGNTWSVLPMGKKIFAISGDSVRVLDEDRRRWQRLLEFPGARSLLAGENNTLFVGSASDGVLQMTLTGAILRRSDPAVARSLARDSDGNVWASGTNVLRVNTTRNGLKLEREAVPGEEHEWVDMNTDPEGHLWVSIDGGVSYRANDTWHAFSRGPNLLPAVRLTADGKGDIWYAYDRGLTVVTNPAGTNLQVQTFPIDERDNVHFFGTDQDNRLWRGTTNGIYIADPEQARHSEWLHLDRTNGLPGNDTNQRSFANDTDGSVWFGIDNSVIHMFPPADLVHPNYSPSVFVSGFSSNSGPFQMADEVDNLQNNTNLTAHLGSLQMDRRNALNFRYRLLPQQTSWTNGTSVDIPLGKIAWGDHKLEVQARLLTGPWSQTSSKAFHILRPFWLSSPALLAFVFIGGVTAVGGRQWRRIRKQREDTPLPELAAWRLAVVSPDLASLEGTLLDDRFEVLKIVARGGFATVWDGHDRQQNNRLCAIKIFRHELLDKSWMEKRFQHEVAALTQIHHPNVVRIYGHGAVPSGAPYLAMEFIHGQTLRDKLIEARLTRTQTASYLRQTATALAEIHSHGVCHRDVKPENLMIRTNGQDLVLIDFSIAIVQDPDETMHGLSRAAGTMHYMAPEQAIGYANESSDIYSLAKIVIEMLTGQRLSALLPDASIDLPDRVRELDLGLSAESTDLLAQALEFDPSRRPNDANAFGIKLAADLEC